MMSNQSSLRAGITCENNSKPGFTFNAVDHIHVSNLKFFECYYDIDYSFDHDIKLITLTTGSLVLVKCIFEDNVGTGMITAAKSNIAMAQSSYIQG